MEEIKVEVGSKKGTDTFEIKSVQIEPYQQSNSNIVNVLINGQDFYSMDELKDYIVQTLKMQNINISKEKIILI
ncbi:MAG: hypothetical protein IKA88_05985 [Clostridia bacterium]|nr:hypothetical protein [Clostridia bacterium]